MTQETKVINGGDEATTHAIAGDRYRRAFIITLAALIVVIGTFGWFFWRSPLNPINRPTQTAANSESLEGAAQEIRSDAGTPHPETPLAPIQLSPQRMQSIGVKIGTVESKIISDEIRSYGNVQPDERRLAYVQTRFAGWIRQVYANAAGDFIRKGQPLFTIYSPDLVASEREYLLAKTNAFSLQQSSVTGVADGAASLIAAAKARLQQFDISNAEIAKLDETGEPVTELTFYSPASGHITERNALPNMYVQPDTKLYSIVDLSDVWVLAQIFQNDAGKIKPGDPAEVTLDAYPGQLFKGKVDYLLPQLDATTRTLPVRLVFPNPALKLRPGMYVNVSVKLPLGQHLIVPDSAVFHSGIKDLVFTYTGEGWIQPHEVELGPHISDHFVVTRGVKSGERIVTSANFLIDSESQLQAAIGSFTASPDAVAATSDQNAHVTANVEFSTEPSTPRKGANLYRVKLTAANGSPVSGAQVSVRSFMPGMPQMGMAAMNVVTPLREKSAGVYEGQSNLETGGTWQLTITAIKAGVIVATKQLDLNVEGGM